MKKMIFWGNDIFPYFLWGVSNVKNEHGYFVESYSGYIKNPEIILDYEDGVTLASYLRSLEDQKDHDEMELREKYSKKLKDVLSEFVHIPDILK